MPRDPWQVEYFDLAIKCSGAVQAHRWTELGEGFGYIQSFNGPHSLFIDTMRTLRVLALAHRLGHVMKGEGDQVIPLLGRLVAHARTTARYGVFYGEGRDIYDVRGRTAHEAIFNVANGAFRCVGTQQGYSGFSTWTRGLSWAMCGFAELLEFVETLEQTELTPFGGKAEITGMMERAAAATCDFYIDHTATDGIPYWDTGAPGMRDLDDPYGRPSEPENDIEPVDSSAAAIAAQGLLRYGRWRQSTGRADGERYCQAGLTVLKTLLSERYLSLASNHQGLVLHSQYHRPNGWDYVPPGRKNPCGEATMWGDYHMRELALCVQRLAENGPYLSFFGSSRRAAMNQRTGRRVALVTGGRRGIGLAVAERLAADGFDLAITGTRDDDVAKAALAKLTSHGVAATFVAGDVAAVADHARVLDAVEIALGPIDVFVSNAGIAPPQRLDVLETTEENFDAVLGVNLRGAFFLAQAVAKRMIARGGEGGRTLIFISSCSAEMVSVNRIEYCISKAALAMAVAGFSVRLAAEGISVFEVRPGIIRTDMTAGVASKYDALIANGLVPARRWGEPADVAAAVGALAKGGLGFATGTVVNVDGALTINRL